MIFFKPSIIRILDYTVPFTIGAAFRAALVAWVYPLNEFLTAHSQHDSNISQPCSDSDDSSEDFLSTNSFESHSSVRSDDTDSILAAVSVLFQDGHEDDHDKESVLERLPNHVVIRIIPDDRLEYGNHKPVRSAIDTVRLLSSRTTLASKSPPSSTITLLDTDNDDERDASHFLLSLDVNATIPSSVNPSLFYQIVMRMHRTTDETASRTLNRLAMSFQRKLRHVEQEQWKDLSARRMRFLKQHQKHSTKSPILSLCDCQQANIAEETGGRERHECYRQFPYDNHVKSVDLWRSLAQHPGIQLTLDYGGVVSQKKIDLSVEACPPTIVTLQTFASFDSRIFIGVPLSIQVELLHATHARIVWFANWIEVQADSSTYIPNENDLGKQISVLIIPYSNGREFEEYSEAYIFSKSVEPLPELPLVKPLRSNWTLRSPFDPNLRVLSYNILADVYVSREVDQQIMYNHCAPKFLDKLRRMPLLLYELLVFKPDIICLQEVDAEIFQTLFEPCLAAHDYQGFYKNKASSQFEGCAMFWSLQVFERCSKDEMQAYFVKDLGAGDDETNDDECSNDIRNLLESNEELSFVVRKKVGQVLQIAQLQLRDPAPDQPRRIVVGNTHLFYHPLASHVRAIQTYHICQQLNKSRKEHGGPFPVILCGDFNCGPLCGAVRLITAGQLSSDHDETWKNLDKYKWSMGCEDFLLEHGYIGNDVDCEVPIHEEEEFQDAVESIDTIPSSSTHQNLPFLRLPPDFPSMISGYSSIPEFTNYAVDFSETLDYIFASEPTATEPFGWKRHDTAPMPELMDMKNYVAMPNEYMPSDHVSILCDFAWTAREQRE